MKQFTTTIAVVLLLATGCNYNSGSEGNGEAKDSPKSTKFDEVMTLSVSPGEIRVGEQAELKIINPGNQEVSRSVRFYSDNESGAISFVSVAGRTFVLGNSPGTFLVKADFNKDKTISATIKVKGPELIKLDLFPGSTEISECRRGHRVLPEFTDMESCMSAGSWNFWNVRTVINSSSPINLTVTKTGVVFGVKKDHSTESHLVKVSDMVNPPVEIAESMIQPHRRIVNNYAEYVKGKLTTVMMALDEALGGHYYKLVSFNEREDSAIVLDDSLTIQHDLLWVKINDKIIFTANDYNGGHLYSYDGENLFNLNLGGRVSGVGNNSAKHSNGKIYLLGDVWINNYRSAIFETDGTALGTKVVATFDQLGVNAISGIASFNGKLFLILSGELFEFDPSREKTLEMRSCRDHQDNPCLSDLINAGYITGIKSIANLLYFYKYDYITGAYIFKRTDGTTQGTKNIGTFSSLEIKDAIGNDLIFIGETPANINQGIVSMWKTNGEEEGTVRLTQLEPNSKSGRLTERWNDKIVFTVDRPDQMTAELWITDGTVSGTKKIVSEFEESSFSHISDIKVYNGQIFISGTVNGDHELWVYSL